MSPGSLITMVIVLSIIWGGAVYFINLAYKSQS